MRGPCLSGSNLRCVSATAAAEGLYELPQEMRDFREVIREIVDAKIRPRAAEIDATGEYPWDVRKLLSEQDILGLPFSSEHGGTGTGTLMLQVAVEEIAKACASTATWSISVPVPVPPCSEEKGRPRMSCSAGGLRTSPGYSPVASSSTARAADLRVDDLADHLAEVPRPPAAARRGPRPRRSRSRSGGCFQPRHGPRTWPDPQSENLTRWSRRTQLKDVGYQPGPVTQDFGFGVASPLLRACAPWRATLDFAWLALRLEVPSFSSFWLAQLWKLAAPAGMAPEAEKPRAAHRKRDRRRGAAVSWAILSSRKKYLSEAFGPPLVVLDSPTRP